MRKDSIDRMGYRISAARHRGRRAAVMHLEVMGAMGKRVIKTEAAPPAIGPYSQAIAANGLIFAAGQIPLDPRTAQPVPGDVRVQTKRVLENLKAVLEAAGSSMDKIVKTTVFLRDLNDFGAMNEIYGEYFQENPPARSTVQVVRLPRDAAVEIEAVALA